MNGMRRTLSRVAILALAAALAILLGCGEDSFVGAARHNRPPTIRMTSGPPEGDTTSYRINFSWIGNDPDGKVDHYEFAICDGAPLGFNHADTVGLDKWRKTLRTDSIFSFSTDTYDQKLTDVYGWYHKVHTFFVRAVDDGGARSDAEYRSFTAKNISPFVNIDGPRNPFPSQIQTLPPIIIFRWSGYDPIDTPWRTQDVDSIRYFVMLFRPDLYDSLSSNVEMFEDRWSPWISYDAPGDSGRSTIIGDDELLELGMPYMLVIQAMDEAGAVTPLFSRQKNVRLFYVFSSPGPLLKVREPYLGTFGFLGSTTSPQNFEVPAGFGLNFQWSADASSYGGEVSTYRYGWDVVDLNDPNEWDVLPQSYLLSAPEIRFNAGIHTLLIEAVDNIGGTTLAQIEVNVFPLEMSRNLLWVDDFYSTDFLQTNYGFPTETEHTTFWLNLLRKAEGFDPTRDIYETAVKGNLPPPTSTVWKYKNVVWTYSSSDDVNAWDNLVRFIPESLVGNRTRKGYNYLAHYLLLGGHVWTEGMGDRQGGLCAVLFGMNQVYPINLRCESAGTSTGCAGDTSGVFSMAYRDYCVTVLDKAQPALRRDSRVPVRSVVTDAMSYAVKDTRDPVTVAHDKLPSTLRLWETVTLPGMFFDPTVRGLYYAELYNPSYWMYTVKAQQQSCFHPMFRMRTRSEYSVVNNATVAFWTTKYADVVADVPGAVAAPSVHFGFPLWFFNRAQVDSVADVIFREWNIARPPQ